MIALRRIQLGLDQKDTPGEVGTPQVGTPQVGTLELGPDEVGPSVIRPLVPDLGSREFARLPQQGIDVLVGVLPRRVPGEHWGCPE